MPDNSTGDIVGSHDVSSELGRLVFEEILSREGGATRADLCKKFDKPRTTIYDALKPMIKANIVGVERREPGTKRRGRRNVYFTALVPEYTSRAVLP